LFVVGGILAQPKGHAFRVDHPGGIQKLAQQLGIGRGFFRHAQLYFVPLSEITFNVIYFGIFFPLMGKQLH